MEERSRRHFIQNMHELERYRAILASIRTLKGTLVYDGGSLNGWLHEKSLKQVSKRLNLLRPRQISTI
jgi:hypothetical protein